MSYQSIFHPSDFTAGDHAAFVHALRIALAAKGELELLHVDGPGVRSEWSEFPHVRQTLSQWGLLPANARREDVLALGLHARKSASHDTQVEKAIVGHVVDAEPDLVVLATHQRTGPSRWLNRTVAETVARESGVKTLFVPRRVTGFVSSETGRIQLETFLIPVDRQPHAQVAIQAAVELAELLGLTRATFTLLHVGPEHSLPHLHTPAREGWSWHRVARGGNPVDEILAAADEGNADLVVMATEGRHGFLDTLRGSVTERVLHGVRCPLLAVPAT